MSDVTIPPVLSQPAVPIIHKSDTPAKILQAAQQFEALLINQLLQSATGNGGWLGTGGDSAGSCATGFAQEQLASSMAKNGGFGLAAMIAKGLERGK
ncbi:MAG TPA: rod-binding protein [Candidatus Sulfopaludibacter sp.]|jgi:Rod binding domain-containing protein|nr:rod-binding protein [Candidatus Sulfopaludibacter sp.]